MIGSFNVLDAILPLAFFGLFYLCYRRGFLPTLASTLLLFVAATVSAVLYNPFIYAVAGNVSNSNSAQTSGAFVYGGFTLAFYVFFEILRRRTYPGLTIQRFGEANHILGAIVGLVFAFLVLSLILLILEYAGLTLGLTQGGELLASLEYVISRSGLVPIFRMFFSLPLAIIKLLFPPGGLPDILAHFAH